MGLLIIGILIWYGHRKMKLQIMNAVIPHKAVEQAPGPTIQTTIEGMTYAFCVARIQRAFKTVPSVAETSVNLPTERPNHCGNYLGRHS